MTLDPATIIAGIRQFGLAADGADLRDLEAAFAHQRGALVEACAQVADEHRARIPGHDPESQSADLVAQGYGNAAFNIGHAIRALAGKQSGNEDNLCHCSWGCVEADNCRRKATGEQSTCGHPITHRFGSGTVSTDGTSTYEWTCQKCGYKGTSPVSVAQQNDDIQSSDGGVEGHAVAQQMPNGAVDLTSSVDGPHLAGIKPGPSETPAGDCTNPGSEHGHDWQVWPETDGQEQRCMKCGAYRKTPAPVAMQDYAPAGTALTADEIATVDYVRKNTRIPFSMECSLLAIIDRLSTSSPAEVSEEELAKFFQQLDLPPPVDWLGMTIVSISGDDEAAAVARALLAKFTIGRRV